MTDEISINEPNPIRQIAIALARAGYNGWASAEDFYNFIQAASPVVPSESKWEDLMIMNTAETPISTPSSPRTYGESKHKRYTKRNKRRKKK